MYNVQIYKSAKQDLKLIVDYLNTLSANAAIKYYDLIVEKIGTFREMPERCPLLRDPQLRLRGYRLLFVDKHMVFFVIKENVVQVHRILYGRMQYEWML